MAIRWHRSRVLLAAVLAALVCDIGEAETSTVEVAVRVEPPVAASSLPAQVLVGFDSGGSGFIVFRVGFMCSADAPFATTATFSMPGAGATTAQVWLAPADPGATFTCGALASPQQVSSSSVPDGAPHASTGLVIVAGCGGNGDRSGTVVVISNP